MPAPATFVPDSVPASFVPDSGVRNANPTPIDPDLLRGLPMPGAPVDYITAARMHAKPGTFLRADEEILAEKIAKASLTGEEMKALGMPAWTAPVERGVVAGLGGLADPANVPYLAGGFLKQAVGEILGAAFLGQGTVGAVSDVGQGAVELTKGNTEKGLEDVSRGVTTAGVFYGPGAVAKLRKGGELHGQEKGQESRQELPLTQPREIQPVENVLPLTPPAEVPKTFVPEPAPQPTIQDVLAKPGAVSFETAAALSGIPKPKTAQETVADALDLKPEPSWPGVPGWGFSPKNTTEVGTFYVPEGAGVEQVRAARDAKFELFEKENQKYEQAKTAAAAKTTASSLPPTGESPPTPVLPERPSTDAAVEAKVKTILSRTQERDILAQYVPEINKRSWSVQELTRELQKISTPEWSIQHGRDRLAWRGMGEKELQKALETGSFEGRGGPYLLSRPDKPLQFASKTKGKGYLVEFVNTRVEGERVESVPLKRVSAIYEVDKGTVRRVPFEEIRPKQEKLAELTPESTGLSVDDQAFALLHDLKGVATVARGNADKRLSKLTQEQSLDFQAEGDRIYEAYLADGDYQKADAAVRSLKDRVVAATKKTPIAPIPQAVAGEPTSKEAKTIDVLAKTKPEHLNEDQAARLKALRSKFPGYVPKDIELPLKQTVKEEEVNVPTVLYHTTSAPINVLNPEGAKFYSKGAVGIHLGTKEQVANLKHVPDKGEKVFPVKVDLVNPLRVTDSAASSELNLQHFLISKGVITLTEIKELRRVYSGQDRLPPNFLQTLLKRKGYDGLVYKNEYEGVGDSFVVFDADQITYLPDFGKLRKYRPAIKDENGKIFIGDEHAVLRKEHKGLSGFVDEQGRFLSLTDIARREGHLALKGIREPRELELPATQAPTITRELNRVRPETPAVESPELSAGKRVGLPHEEVALKELGIEQGTVAHGALQRLASRPDFYGKQNAALADFLVRHFAPMLRMVTIDSRGVSEAGRPSFLPHVKGNLLGEVRLGVGAEKQSGFTVPERLLHEGAHAATWWSFEHPTTEAARSARLKMEQLLGESKKRWQPTGNRNLDYQMRYYHRNPHEFIAGIFNSWEMREHLSSFKLGERSLWEQIKDAVKELLGVKPGTALDQAFDALIESQSEPVGSLRSAYPKEYLEAPAPGDPLPFRFKTYADEKADIEARGIGKVPILGALFDPRAKRTLPEEKVILTNSIGKQKADAGIALWLETKKGEARPFVPDEQGRIEFLNGTHGYMSDAIEAELRVPGSQSFTPEQRAFVRDWKEQRDEAIAYAQGEGVKFFLDSDGNPRALDESYFPRPRIGTRGEPVTPKGIGVGSRPGSKQGPMKERYYETEKEGVSPTKPDGTPKESVLYEPDPYNRQADWLRAVYRSVADARLAKDPTLKGRAGIRLVPARDAVTGIQIPGAFQIVGKGPKYGEGEVYGVPALKGRVFPVDIAKKLSEFYTSQPNKYARFTATINDTLKGFKFAADVSAPLNQGLPLMVYNPKAWAKATVASYGAFLEALVKRDTTVPKKYLENPENLRAAQTMVENGSSLFRLQDFLTGTQKGHFAAEFPIPVIGPPLRQTLGRAVRAGGESMGTFLSIAKIEAFKALEPIARENGTSMAALTEIVDNLILSGRMEQIGVGQGRALTERLIFNAPSYLRAFANVVANAGQGKMEGSVARRSIVGLLTAVSIQAYLAYKLSGYSDDEIKERMTPGSSKFLRFQYRLDKEKSVELSFGNIFLSFTRLLGDTWEIATGKKSLRPGTEGNPWLRWMSYRKSPVIDLAQQVYTGRDYRGMPTTALQSLGRAAAPIPLEPVANVFAGTESPKQGAIEFGAQFLGANAYPKNARSMDEIAREKFGRPVSKLSERERLAVAKERAALPKPSLNEQQMIEKAASEREFENRRKLVAGLQKEQREFIEKYSLSLSGFQTSYEKNRLQMPITPEERALHLSLIQREYQTAISRLMASGRVEQFAKDGTLQRRLNVVLTDARERAMKGMKREVRKLR